MEAGGVFAVPVVAASVEDDGGDVGLCHEVEDVIVPGGEVAVVQLHLAKTVILMRIGPGDPEHKVWREGVHGGGQAAFQRFEIGVAGDVPGEFDVQGARCLDGGVVSTKGSGYYLVV